MRHSFSNLFYMLKYIHKATPSRIYVGLFITTINVFSNILVSVYMPKAIIDHLVEGEKQESLWLFIVCCFGVMLLKSILFALYSNIYAPKAELKTNRYMQTMMFEKIRNIDVRYYDDPEYFNEYTRAMQEIDTRTSAVFNTFIGFFTNLFSSVSLLSVIVSLNPIVIIFSLFTIVLNILITTKNNKVNFNYFQERIGLDRKKEYVKRVFYLQQYAKENKILKLYPMLYQKFDQTIQLLFATLRKYSPRLFAFSAVHSLVQGISLFGSVAYIIHLVFQGSISIGSFTALLSASQTFTSYAQGLFNFYPEIQKHSLYIDNLRNFLSTKSVIEVDSGDIFDADIESLACRDISFSYVEGNTILQNLTLQIHKNQKVAVVGPNGAGKSTIVKLLLRLYDPQQGAVCLNGEDIRRYNIRSIRDKIGVAFQDFQCYAVTIAENILLREVKTSEDEATVWACLQKCGLADKVRKLPEGIHTYVTTEFEENGVIFSGGELQKLALARAFAHNYDIVILDEPSSSLDPIAEYNFFEMVRTATEQKSVLYISHRLSSVTKADYIYYVDNGQVLEEGTHSQLMLRNGKYAEMFRLQAESYVS